MSLPEVWRRVLRRRSVNLTRDDKITFSQTNRNISDPDRLDLRSQTDKTGHNSSIFVPTYKLQMSQSVCLFLFIVSVLLAGGDLLTYHLSPVVKDW